MNFAEFSIRNQVFSVIVILLSLLGGWSAYQDMPRLEDPEFTIRSALVITQYPGASPLEVAEEVSDPLEQALQQLQEVDVVKSVSSAGPARRPSAWPGSPQGAPKGKRTSSVRGVPTIRESSGSSEITGPSPNPQPPSSTWLKPKKRFADVADGSPCQVSF